MLSFSSEHIIILDDDMMARNMNDRFLEFIGLSRTDVLNKNIENIPEIKKILPSILPGIRESLDGKELNLEARYNGSIYLIIKFIPTVFEDGKKGVTIIMQDITGMKNAERAIIESEEKFRSIIEQSLDGILLIDNSGKIVEVNKGLEFITGYEREKILGVSVWDIYHTLIADDTGKDPASVQNNKKRLKQYVAKSNGDGVRNLAIDILRPDGDRRALYLTYYTIHLQKGNLLCCFARDITEQKQAEEALRKARDRLEAMVKERTLKLEQANTELKAEIGQRISYEKALQDSKENFRSLVETINDVAWEIDTEGRFTYISPQIKDMMGYEPSEFIGKTILVFLSPAHAGDILEGFKVLFSNPAPYTLQETYLRHKDGHEIIAEANSVVLYDENGKFRGYRGVTRDVTTRKKTEDALRKTEDRFRNLVENVNDWIWETDNTGRFIYSSPKIRDMLGYDPADVIGMRPFDLMEPEKGKKMYYRFIEIAKRGDVFAAMEADHLHKDGHTVYTEASGMPIRDAKGSIVGYTGITRDVTERKLAEEAAYQRQREINTLLDSLPGMAFFKDTKGVHVMVNQYFCDAIGLKKSDIIGKADIDIFPEELARKIRKDDAMVLKSGKPLFTEEEMPLKNKLVKMATRKTPLKDYGGHIIGLVGFALDVTGRKEAEKALQESEEKFRGFVENINDIVWEMDSNALFTYISPKIRDILGFEPGHYFGKPITNFMPPEDVPKFIEGFGRIFAYPRPYSLENLRMAHRDGHLRSMEVNGSPFYNEKGVFMGFRGVTRDITARKVIEEDLRKSEPRPRADYFMRPDHHQGQ